MATQLLEALAQVIELKEGIAEFSEQGSLEAAETQEFEEIFFDGRGDESALSAIYWI